MLSTSNSLALRYRPQTFEDVIGQTTLVKTLQQTIKADNCPPAILLTGTRGIGKTSIARIIAKAINCSNSDLGNVCNKCSNCLSITNGTAMDVLEMDAASNTGVNDIREIITNARYKPVSFKFKVYIIDEVHMLSQGAFNALLKTLEEPPGHCTFILATTEIHKIPLTILSRCQRFNFRRLTANELSTHYQKIAKIEGYELPQESADLIAEAADGSVRDGMSILDQAMNTCHEKKSIEADKVREMLGISDKTLAKNIVSYLIHGDIQSALLKVEQSYYDGKDLNLLLKELLELTHQCAILVTTKTFNNDDEFEKLISKVPIAFFIRSWQILGKLTLELRQQPMPSLFFNMAIIKIGYLNIDSTPEELINKMLDQQEVTNNITNASESSTISSSNPTNSTLSSPKLNQNKPHAQTSSNRENKAIDNTVNNHSSLQSNNDQPLEELLGMVLQQGELMLYHWLTNDVSIHELDLQNRTLVIQAQKHSPHSILKDIAQALRNLTGDVWQVNSPENKIISSRTYHQQKEVAEQKANAELLQSSLVKDMMKVFPELNNQ